MHEVSVVVRPPDRNCPVGQSLQPVSLEALGVLLTNVPASHALCAVQDVAVVVAPDRHLPDAQLLQPVSRDSDGVVETSASAEEESDRISKGNRRRGATEEGAYISPTGT